MIMASSRTHLQPGRGFSNMFNKFACMSLWPLTLGYRERIGRRSTVEAGRRAHAEVDLWFVTVSIMPSIDDPEENKHQN